MLVSADDSPSGLPAKLAAAQRQEREAERRAEAAESALGRATKAAAAPAAEARRLRAALEAAHAEADMLRSRLGARERQLSPVRAGTPGGKQPCGGLAAEMEDAEDARTQELEAELASLRCELAAAQEARAQLAARCAQLEQQLKDAQQQDGGSSAASAQQAAEAEVREGELARLRGEKASLKAEVRRLRQEAAQGAAEVDHLTQRLQQLVSGGGWQAASQRSSPTKAAAAAAAQHPGQHAQEQARRQEGASPTCNASQRPSSPLGRRPGSACAAGQALRHAARHVAGAPSEADLRQFGAEMRHELAGAAWPGVVPRYPHLLGDPLAVRGDLQVGGWAVGPVGWGREGGRLSAMQASWLHARGRPSSLAAHSPSLFAPADG